MELRVVLVSLCIAAASATHYGVKNGAGAQSSAFAGALTLPGLPDLTKGLAGAGSGSLSGSASFAQSSASSYAASNSGSFVFGGSDGSGKIEGGSPVGSGAVANAAAFAGASAVAGTVGQASPEYSSSGAPHQQPSHLPSGLPCQGVSCGFNSVPSKCSSGSCDTGLATSTGQGHSNSPSVTNKPKDDGLLGYVALEEDDRPGKVEPGHDGSEPGQYGVAAENKSPQFEKPCSSLACGQPHSNEPSDCSGPTCGSGPSCSTPGDCSQHNTASANTAAFAGAAAGGYGDAAQGSPGNTRTPILSSKPGYASGLQYSGSFGGAPGILKPNDYSLPNKHLSPNYPQHSPSFESGNPVPLSGSALSSPSPQTNPQTPSVVARPLYSGPSSYAPHGQTPQYDTPAGLPALADSGPLFGQKPQPATPAGGSSISSSGAFAGAAAGVYTGSFGGPPGLLKPNDFSFHGKPTKPHGASYGKPSYQPISVVPSGPINEPYQGSFSGAPGVVRPGGPIGTETFPNSQPGKPNFGCSGSLSCQSPSNAPYSPSGSGCSGLGCSNSGSYHGSFGGPPGILNPTGPSNYAEKPDYSANPSVGCSGGSSCGGHGSSNEGPSRTTQTSFGPSCGGTGCSNNVPHQGGFNGSPNVFKPSGTEEVGSFHSSQHNKPIKDFQAEGSPNQGSYGGAPYYGVPSVAGAGAFAAATARASASSYSGPGGYGRPGEAQGGHGSESFNGEYGVKGGFNRPKHGGCEGACGGGNGENGSSGDGAAAGSASFGLNIGRAGPGPFLGAAREVAHSFHELGHNIGKNIGGLLLGGAGAGNGGLAVSGSFASSGAKSYAY